MHIIKRAAVLLSAVFVIAALGVVVVNDGGSVSADGAGSPVECNSNPNVNPNADNVHGSQTGTDDEVIVDVGDGFVVDGVCIKSGGNMFDGSNGHSGVLGNGTLDGNPKSGGAGPSPDCYEVSGVGTQEVTVVRNHDTNRCQEISHIDVLFSEVNGNGENGNGDENGNGEEPENGEVPEEEGAVLGIDTEALGVAEAPVEGVDAGAGGLGALAGLGMSAATVGYGLVRLRRRL